MHSSGRAKHEACPACRARGADQRGDNLGRYPDGHAWCFSCGYYEGTDAEKRMFSVLRAGPEWRRKELDSEEGFLQFPTDFSRYIPQAPMEWLKKYGIVNQEIIKHRFGWSEERKMLIMPVFDTDNRVKMWQGRNFNITNTELKYLTKGPKSDIVHIVWPEGYKLVEETFKGITRVVIVEGLLDAIKVGRVTPAVPLWGSKAPLQLLRKLSKQFERLGVWLDSDKTAEAVRTAIRASQYMHSYVISTNSDPKEYSEVAIKFCVTEGDKDKAFKMKDDGFQMIGAQRG